MWPVNLENLELSGNLATFEESQEISQKWPKSGKSQGILVIGNESSGNFFQHRFNFTFTEQILSHFMSHFFHS